MSLVAAYIRWIAPIATEGNIAIQRDATGQWRSLTDLLKFNASEMRKIPFFNRPD